MQSRLSATTSRRRRQNSASLPRGWRYHSSTGLFEHKRTGRLQAWPPDGSVERAGTPLQADLAPCDEEQALIVDLPVVEDEAAARQLRSLTWGPSKSFNDLEDALGRGHAARPALSAAERGRTIRELRAAFEPDAHAGAPSP